MNEKSTTTSRSEPWHVQGMEKIPHYVHGSKMNLCARPEEGLAEGSALLQRELEAPHASQGLTPGPRNTLLPNV